MSINVSYSRIPRLGTITTGNDVDVSGVTSLVCFLPLVVECAVAVLIAWKR